MARYVVRRLLQMIPVLIGISLIVFTTMRLVPGDPVLIMMGEEAGGSAGGSLEEYQRMRALLGLDQPLPVQFGRWAGHAAMGDLGKSLLEREPVLDLLLQRLPATIELATASLVMAVIVAIPMGVWAAVRRGRWADRAGLLLATIGVSLPGFWVGLMLIIVFALWLGWLPTSGRGMYSVAAAFWRLFTHGDFTSWWESLRYLAMPAISLGLGMISLLLRLTRYSMIDVLDQDYIRTARAKGVAERIVIFRHALRNALMPVITVVGLQTGYLMSGAVLIETVFSWPGIGRLGYISIKRLDYPVIQGVVLMVATVFCVVNFMTDLVYAWADPRIRYE